MYSNFDDQETRKEPMQKEELSTKSRLRYVFACVKLALLIGLVYGIIYFIVIFLMTKMG